MKVYGMWYSNATGRVLATLFEKEVEVEVVPVDIMKGEQKKPEYLAIQPFGQIPVLEDGDLMMYGSRACMRYICNKYPEKGTKLYGSSLNDKAMVEQWLEVESQECCPLMFDLVNLVLFGPMFHGKAADEAAVVSLTEKLGKVLDVYEAQLSKYKYLAGDFISLADIAHLPVCNYYFNIAKQQDLFKTRKHVQGWWQDISNRPSWEKIFEKASPFIEQWKAQT